MLTHVKLVNASFLTTLVVVFGQTRAQEVGGSATLIYYLIFIYIFIYIYIYIYIYLYIYIYIYIYIYYIYLDMVVVMLLLNSGSTFFFDLVP